MPHDVSDFDETTGFQRNKCRAEEGRPRWDAPRHCPDVDKVYAGWRDQPGFGDIVDLELDIWRDPAWLDWRFAALKGWCVSCWSLRRSRGLRCLGADCCSWAELYVRKCKDRSKEDCWFDQVRKRAYSMPRIVALGSASPSSMAQMPVPQPTSRIWRGLSVGRSVSVKPPSSSIRKMWCCRSRRFCSVSSLGSSASPLR